MMLTLDIKEIDCRYIDTPSSELASVQTRNEGPHDLPPYQPLSKDTPEMRTPL